jgi:hypothetical protein
VVFVRVKADGAGLAAFEVNVASELADSMINRIGP